MKDNLNNIIAAFKKRSKAIKHQSCIIEFENEDDNGFERLNIDCERLDRPPVRVRISVWDDGSIFFRTCQSTKKGWKFNVHFNGKVDNIDAHKIVKNFENSLFLSDEKELMHIWKEISPYRD